MNPQSVLVTVEGIAADASDDGITSTNDGILITGFYDGIVFRAIIVDDGTVIQNLSKNL